MPTSTATDTLTGTIKASLFPAATTAARLDMVLTLRDPAKQDSETQGGAPASEAPKRGRVSSNTPAVGLRSSGVYVYALRGVAGGVAADSGAASLQRV